MEFRPLRFQLAPASTWMASKPPMSEPRPDSAPVLAAEANSIVLFVPPPSTPPLNTAPGTITSRSFGASKVTATFGPPVAVMVPALTNVLPAPPVAVICTPP